MGDGYESCFDSGIDYGIDNGIVTLHLCSGTGKCCDVDDVESGLFNAGNARVAQLPGHAAPISERRRSLS